MPRNYRYDILPEIKARYATRAFSGERLSRDEILPIIEAASYAPSAFNEQPWRFVVADEGDRLEKLRSVILKGNAWALSAPVLILITAKKDFAYNGKPNAHSRYDTGTASGFLLLEAARRGIASHVISGFLPDKARELLEIPEEYDIISLVVLGKPRPWDTLSDEEKAAEVPGERRPIEDLML